MPRERRPPLVSVSLSAAFCVALAAAARPQQQPPPPGPRPTPRESPFRSRHLYGLPVRFVAMNDEACPLQLLAGRTEKVSGSWVMSVQLKSLADAAIDGFRLDALVFDSEGRYRDLLDLEPGPGLPPRRARWVELPFARHELSPGDVVVVAVREATSPAETWRSDRREVRRAARHAVSRRD